MGRLASLLRAVHRVPSAVVHIVVTCLATGGLVVACKGEPAEVPQVPVEAPPASELPRPPTPEGAVLPSVASGPSREAEPNDGRERASPLPMNGAVVGVLSAPASTTTDGASPPAIEDGLHTDEDWYELTLDGTSMQQVRLQLTPEGRADLVLEWMTAEAPPPPQAPKSKGRVKGAPKSDVLASIDNAGDGEVEILPPVSLSPGRHYFRVKAKPAKAKLRKKGAPPPPVIDAPYRLSTTIIDPEPGLEQEPNGDTASAGLLRPGEPRKGFCGWAKDLDWYKLDLQGADPGGYLRIDVSGVPDVRLRVWLVDKTKATIVKLPEGKGSLEAGRSVVVRDVMISPDAQPYYVAVDALRGASPSERYTLVLSLEPADVTRESEPNWRPANASRVPPNAEMRGFISHPTDWDVFRFESLEPMQATITVTGVPDVDLQVEAIVGSRVTMTVNDAPTGAPETLPLVQVGPEPAFIRVTSRLNTYNADKPYLVTSSFTAAGLGEVEPNGDFAEVTGTTLRAGQALDGHIHPRADLDVYAFDVTGESGTLSPLSLELSGVPGMSLALQLYDHKKSMITKKTGITLEAPGGITHDFAPGRYYVRVREETGQNASADHAYTIRLGQPSVTPPDAVPDELAPPG